ncbi:copper oxidase [Thermoplasmatales archaeon SW_10_69_26]|nr:MAG: copper oxidase [Thermoplasmatales archaeon SW_10_69_26]
MNRALLVVGLLLAAGLVASTSSAKVVNENTDDLPPGCEEISEEVTYTVRGGSEPARGMDGVAFTFDERSFEVPACAEVTVTFVNTDPIRHQFMVHGTYPDGSTLIELPGEGEDTATWIAPSTPASLMVHCGVNQHQQKGMKAQFLVAGGEGDVPNVPGISGLPPEDRHDAHAHGEETADDRPAPGPGALLALLGAAVAVGLRGNA